MSSKDLQRARKVAARAVAERAAKLANPMRVVKNKDKVHLPFETNARGATIYFKHLINGYQRAKSERDELLAAITRFAETWPNCPYRDEARDVLQRFKSGEMRGAPAFEL